MTFAAAWHHPDYALSQRWEDDQPECGWCGFPILIEHLKCDREIEARTCLNAECPEQGTCYVDAEQGDPCEMCGQPVGGRP